MHSIELRLQLRGVLKDECTKPETITTCIIQCIVHPPTLSPNSNVQIIVGGVACTPQDVRLYASCTLLAATTRWGRDPSDGGAEPETNKGAIEACVEWLMENEFINIQKEGEGLAAC